MYKTAVVFETPHSALWPFQNATKRFVAYSKHYKALCGLFKRHRALCGVLFCDLTLKTEWLVDSQISHSYFPN